MGVGVGEMGILDAVLFVVLKKGACTVAGVVMAWRAGRALGLASGVLVFGGLVSGKPRLGGIMGVE